MSDLFALGSRRHFGSLGSLGRIQLLTCFTYCPLDGAAAALDVFASRLRHAAEARFHEQHESGASGRQERAPLCSSPGVHFLRYHRTRWDQYRADRTLFSGPWRA